MKKVFALFYVVLILLVGLVGEAQADLAKPPVTPEPAKRLHHAEITVATDPNAFDARLQISEATLKNLRAALAELPDQERDEPVSQSTAFSSGRTLLAGFSLFVAISLGGVWLVRSGSSRGQKTIAALMLGGALVGAAAIITRANAGPPPAYRWRSLTKNLSEGRPTSAEVMIEIVPEGTGIRLIIPLKPASTGASRASE